jgi:hypothetical protein
MDGLRPLTLVLSRPCITGIGPGMTFIYYYNHNSSTFACCCQAFLNLFIKTVPDRQGISGTGFYSCNAMYIVQAIEINGSTGLGRYA